MTPGSRSCSYAQIAGEMVDALVARQVAQFGVFASMTAAPRIR